MAEERVLVTKGSAFVESLIVQGVPYELILISTGHIRNRELEHILLQNLDALVTLLQSHVFIEVDRTAMYAHY